MLIAIYLLSVILCGFLFAAILVNGSASRHHPFGWREITLMVVCVVCPVLNTVIALTGIAGGVLVMVEKNK